MAKPPNMPQYHLHQSILSCTAHDDGQQFGLPLDAPWEAWLLPMDHLDGHTFTKVLTQLKPRAIADLRHFRRFDLLGLGSEMSRSAIKDSGAAYLPFEIPLHSLEKHLLGGDLSNRCLHVLNEIEVMTGKISGPLLFLVHADQHARLLSMYLAPNLMSRTNKPWAIKQRA
jgi:hypothetical protein